MHRPPASVVVLACGPWAHTRVLLDALRPTVGARDEILVAGPDPDGTLARRLRRHPWARPVAVAGAAPAEAANAGAAAARHDVVVFTEPPALPVGRWLDALLAAFADPGVMAAGPRFDRPLGLQELDEDCSFASTGELRAFVRAWEAEHRGEVRPVPRLVLQGLAVRRQALQAAGWLDPAAAAPAANLCARLSPLGAVVVAEASFVHLEDLSEDEPAAPAPVGGPLVSACLIVRDEEDNLPACLASLGALADEVVVYDTGSHDGTVALARAAGATVIEGHWDDDFARARNAALAACRGEWVLHVDADEVVEGDAVALRAELGGATGVDKLDVAIDNVDGTGQAIAFTHRAARLFRRTRGHWSGRLHEQVVARPGQPALVAATTAAVRLVHSGYRHEVVASRGKLERNIRVAEADLGDDRGHRGLLLTNLGRALGAAGRHDEALERFSEALATSDEPVVRRLALRHGAETLLDTGRPADALEWTRRLREASERQGMADYLEGIARANLGEHDRALACFERVGEVTDDDGFEIPTHVLELRRAFVLLAERRWSEAADALLPVVADTQHVAAVWALAADALWRAGRDAGPLGDALAGRDLVQPLGQVLNAPPPAGDALAEALWARSPGEPALLAFVARLAARLPVERAFTWASRLRAVGIGEHCPLVGLAGDEARPALERLQAAAAAAGAYGDPRAGGAVKAVAPVVAEPELAAALVTLSELAPALLPAFVVAAATGTRRSLALGRALAGLGAPAEAAQVVEAAVRADAGRDSGAVAEARAWLRTATAGTAQVGRG